MSEVEYLALDDLVRMTNRLGYGPVRDLGLLESACARPRTSAFGMDAYPTIELKAAALLQSICANHALVDGNKRLALVAVGVFLRDNGRAFRRSQDDAFELVMAVIEEHLDVPEIAARLADPEPDSLGG